MADVPTPDTHLQVPEVPVESSAREGSPSRALLVLAALLFLFSAAIVAYSLGARSAIDGRGPSARRATDEPGPRRMAPAFRLRSLRGEERISLADFRGQVVVLNFFASWCGPCKLEAADLQRTWQATRGQGVVFIGVAVQDHYRDAQAFLAQHGITYPAVIDETGDVMEAYRVTAIPTTIFVTPDGAIAGSHAGIFVGDEGVARLQERIARARGGAR
jgi:peroxiredoxin